MTTQQILLIIIAVVQITLILRFHLEWSKVDAFMQPAATIRKLTNPLVLPVKKQLPYAVKPWAAIIIAIVLTLLAFFLFYSDSVMVLVVDSVLTLCKNWMLFLKYGIFLYVIGSWLQMREFARANYFLDQIFAPVLRPIRRIIPPLGGLDFSAIVLLIGLTIAQAQLNMLGAFLLSRLGQ